MGSLEGSLESLSLLWVLETGSELLEHAGGLICKVIADPHICFVTVGHWLQLARRSLGDHEVTDWLKSFFLAHDKPDLFLLGAPKQLSVSNAPLLPLVVSEPEQLDSLFIDADLPLSA